MPETRADRSRPNPKARPELRQLQVFVGRWNTTGEILSGPTSPAAKLKAVDVYEWLPGGFFLLHRVDARVGRQRVRSIEILGAGARGALATWSFDDQGNVGEYRASLRGGVWKIHGKAERFHGKFSKNLRTLTGTWERRRGSKWIPWMEITLIRAE